MSGRIVDEKFEKEVRKGVDEGVKEARGRVDKGVAEARKTVDKGLTDARNTVETARKTLESEEEKVSDQIREEPLKWVAGAFIAGLLVGKIISR